jgi:hypothetical protein
MEELITYCVDQGGVIDNCDVLLHDLRTNDDACW